MTALESSHEARPPAAVPVGARDSGQAFTPTPPLNSDQLLGGQRAVTIAHEGAQYILRATRNGKLILTK